MKHVAFCLLFLITLLSACEKPIDPGVRQQPAKLVVDAEIENGRAPFVVLTRSQGYFNKIDSSALGNSFVRNATVTVSDGTVTQQLREFVVPVRNGQVVYYTIDPAQPNPLTGAFGKSYKLTIQSEGKLYESTTTIPVLRKRIDSMWARPAPRPEFGWEMTLWVRAVDPPGLGDYIRYFTRKNSEPFYPGYYSAYDDQFVDGKTYALQVDAGMDKNLPADDRTPYFAKGDTVTLKFCNIDRGTFDFWRTWEYSFGAIGNPFGTPTRVQGNISNGALGAFSGYAAQYRTIIIPQ